MHVITCMFFFCCCCVFFFFFSFSISQCMLLLVVESMKKNPKFFFRYPQARNYYAEKTENELSGKKRRRKNAIERERKTRNPKDWNFVLLCLKNQKKKLWKKMIIILLPLFFFFFLYFTPPIYSILLVFVCMYVLYVDYYMIIYIHPSNFKTIQC